MNEVKLTLELGPETMKQIHSMLTELVKQISCAGTPFEAPIKKAETLPAEIVPISTAETIAEKATDTGDAELPQPKYTREEAQSLVQKLASPKSGKRDRVRELVHQYSKKITTVPLDKLDELMEKLIALDNEEA